ncbi:hypothetical protein MNB_SM-7-1046 [hydrothermal vent metagenome]|uniref:Uncharacterized protein n=1 Tax=hydrothermal vent metagenome TaxID=652676 RepID=A0A1W1B9P7_9ZZZZ
MYIKKKKGEHMLHFIKNFERFLKTLDQEIEKIALKLL